MGDKVKELDERMEKLENRLKSTFIEIERRFENLKVDQPAVVGIEERIQEVEDLVLLLQLEITKIKEKTGTEVDFGTTPSPQRDLEERIEKLEHVAVGGAKTMPLTTHEEKKIEELERKIEQLEARPVKHGSTKLEDEMEEIDRRLAKLEAARTHAAHVPVARTSVYEDVRKILQAP